MVALVYRMHALGLLTDWQYRALFVEMSRRGYRKDEPEQSPRESSHVLAKVLQSLREEGGSLAEVARGLRITPDELRKIVFGLVLMPVEGTGPDGAGRERPDLRLVQE